ncbi:MAG: hypothetical protein ABID67_02195 [Candidatus Nealsonbacteria bacterium]
MERWRIGVGEFGQRLDLTFASDGKLIDSMCVGVHNPCGGFIDCRRVSQTHYALCCGACGLRILLPIEIHTKEEIIEFFCQQGFHKKGEELEICIECEGRGWHREERFETQITIKNGYPGPTENRLRKITVDCCHCQKTGIIQKKAVV